ncbi:hypothetical protein L1987_45155 [Smallanthus sonchifolius]|uniref:Uncharacterized protein n=1 Tax=Smallanthus sonchifolius TaxID=185202 RepID=A0ACB9GS73_9ASTR|nr:hypothetical protein L1987_45155 [Smallanthus sonchifolius]
MSKKGGAVLQKDAPWRAASIAIKPLPKIHHSPLLDTPVLVDPSGSEDKLRGSRAQVYTPRHPSTAPPEISDQISVYWTKMASTACFMIISRNDIPIYEAEVGTAPKKEEAAHQHQFILHAALDVVQDLAWTTSAMFLKAIDRFNDLVVSVYVTAGHILVLFFVENNVFVIVKWLSLGGSRFFQTLLNPLYLPGSRVTSSHFDTKVRALARRYL